MKIAIIGYGRMGREIEIMALDRGHEITAIIDNETDWDNKRDAISGADVAIEFSMPEIAAKNIRCCFEAGLPVVSGTTGWTDSFEEIRKICLEGGHAFFYASNFSPGMNIMFELNKNLAAFMSKYPDYRILVEEIHHSGKKDSPSGT
ncbi:MAG: 4-hydroxy-tetrahydrodipicolinate reductase, partial [Bacteroidales bacterium]|nr:4-hydroxy-tetrahydrodipicolinate reductase [Bacteroidales bacterium]